MLNVEENGPILRVTLNRPEVRNAFNDELIFALTQVFENLSDSVRAVVLAGEGKSFCAGGDLNWMRKAAGYTQEENVADALKLAGLFEKIATCPAVVIAKVRGAAFGGGCGLVAASDYCLAANDALFSFSEVRLGLVPATISRFVIPKIGPGHARALFSTGIAFGAERAEKIGLIHEVCPLEELDSKTEDVVNQVLSVGPKAAHACKEIAMGPVLSGQQGAELLAKMRAGDEGKEGVAAFLDRRAASFVVKK